MTPCIQPQPAPPAALIGEPTLLHTTVRFVGVASTPIQDLGMSPADSFHAMTCLEQTLAYIAVG